MSRAHDGLAVIIPARLHSTRLPRKLLQSLAGQTVLEWTWRRACEAVGSDSVWIATDSSEIDQAVTRFGGRVVKTGACHCGTERVAAAAEEITPTPSRVINLQGDEPLIEPAVICAVAQSLSNYPDTIVTCAAPLQSFEDWSDPAVVKLIPSQQGFAIYFSRQPIPGSPEGVGPGTFRQVREMVFHHVGLYGYPAGLLRAWAGMPVSPLERAEGLEQLRVLEAGIPIRVVRVDQSSPSVDTPKDLQRVRRLFANGAAGQADEVKGVKP